VRGTKTIRSYCRRVRARARDREQFVGRNEGDSCCSKRGPRKQFGECGRLRRKENEREEKDTIGKGCGEREKKGRIGTLFSVKFQTGATRMSRNQNEMAFEERMKRRESGDQREGSGLPRRRKKNENKKK
jgi:hypothetical protein